MLAIALMLSISFTSCFDDENEEEWIEQPAIETGLCGMTWVWEKTDSGNGDNPDEGYNPDINPGKSIVREVYVFDISGKGYHEYSYADGEIAKDNFTWKSYKYGTNRLLSLMIEGYEIAAETLYAVENMTILRMLVVNETGTGTTTKEFRAE